MAMFDKAKTIAPAPKKALEKKKQEIEIARHRAPGDD